MWPGWPEKSLEMPELNALHFYLGYHKQPWFGLFKSMIKELYKEKHFTIIVPQLLISLTFVPQFLCLHKKYRKGTLLFFNTNLSQGGSLRLKILRLTCILDSLTKFENGV